MDGRSDANDYIVLTDEDSPDEQIVTKTPFERTGGVIHINSSANSAPVISSGILRIIPRKEQPVAELLKPSSGIKNLQTTLTEAVGEMLPAQMAEAAKQAMIDIVRQFPPLWKSSNEFYYNNQYCALLWNNIAGVLSIDVKTAKTRWRKLRDLYKKEFLKGKQTGCRSQNPLFDRMSFLDEEILLIKQRADKLRGAMAKPSTSAAIQTANQVTAPLGDNDDEDDDDNDCMIIDEGNDDSHQNRQNANKNEAKKLTDDPTSNAWPPQSTIQPRKLSELQNVLRTSPEDNIPSSSYYIKESVPRGAKRKSSSPSPEIGGKSQKVSIPSRTDSPQSPPPEIEYADNGGRMKSKIFVTHAFPDIAWTNCKSKVMDSSVTSNTLPNPPTSVESGAKTSKNFSKIKSTARKSTGSQYLNQPNLNAVCSSSTVAQVEERHSPQSDGKAAAATPKPQSSGVRRTEKSKSLSSKIDKVVDSSSSNVGKPNPKRETTVPPKPPGESTLPTNSAPGYESLAPVTNLEAPALPAPVQWRSAEIESSPAKPAEIESAKPDEKELSERAKENENFLLSLLPEVNSMTNKQFRKLRKYSSALISLIMDGE